ncbi:MAG: S66 peptidase family protein [Symbiobacteriia bacterium]
MPHETGFRLNPAARPLKPKALRPGDLVALASPAGPSTAATVEPMAAQLEAWGFRVRVAAHAYSRWGYLGGTDAERAQDLNDLFRDPEVRAIFAVRGGYGVTRILPYLDLDAVRRDPKAVIGFSDITALHLALARVGVISFHGPVADVAGKRRSDYSLGWLQRALTAPEPLGTVGNPPDGPTLYTLRSGRASGPLVGGNLTLITAVMGTPYEIETAGSILLMEDVEEAPYRIDRMLTQLLLAGKLEQVRGIVFGEPVGLEDPEADLPTLSLDEVLADRLGPLGIPVLVGFAAAHGFYRATLPLGVRVTLDADGGTLTFDEAATVD